MWAANTYDIIHLGTEADDAGLGRLAELDPAHALQPPALIGHIDGEPAAAISLADLRIVADPQRSTDQLRAYLRVRAAALRAYEASPSLPVRMLAALPATARSGHTKQSGRTTQCDRATDDGAATARTAGNGRADQRPVRRRMLVTS